MITIRPIRLPETDAAKDVICRCFIEFWAEEGATLEEMRRMVDAHHGLDDVDNVQAAYFDSGGTFLAVLDGGRLVGSGALSRLSSQVCELDRMWLLPEYRRQGIGHGMVRRLFAFARRHGYRTVRLHTSSDLRGAIAFYEKLGFRHIEKYRGVKYSDVFMEREL